jgi:polyisoprenoid-binding protein YceI
MRSLPLYLMFAVLALAAAGCADPAANAPDAVVAEPAAESAPAAEATMADVYGLSEDSTIGFVGSKVTGSHEGGFKSFTGTVSVAGGMAEGSSVDVTIDTTSLWTDTEKLTGHLKSADFFDVATYPTASFKSTAIAANDDGTYTLTGNLDLHGVTKQISFPANVEVGDGAFSASAEFSINRMDFGIKFPGKPDDLIREEVLIKLDLKSASDDGMGMGDDGMGGEDMAGEGEDAAS